MTPRASPLTGPLTVTDLQTLSSFAECFAGVRFLGWYPVENCMVHLVVRALGDVGLAGAEQGAGGFVSRDS